MKYNREDLLKSLDAVKGGLDPKGLIEQGSDFIIQGGRVSTYNDAIMISAPLDLGFEAAVPSDRFLEYLSRCKAEEVEIDVSGNEMLLKAGRSKAGIAINPQIKLDLSEVPKPEKWFSVPENFMEALKFCIFSASTDMTKQILTCIHVRDEYVESSDDNRASRFILSSAAPFEMVVPATSVEKLVRFEITKAALSNGWVHFKDRSGLVFSCHSYSQPFPNLDECMKVEGAKIAVPKGMDSKIDRARIFVDAKMKQDEVVTVTISEGEMRIEGRSESGWCEERAKLEYSGKDLRFQVHPDFLLQMLKILDEITIGDPSDINARIKLEGKHFTHVVCMMAEEIVPAKKPRKAKKEDSE